MAKTKGRWLRPLGVVAVTVTVVAGLTVLSTKLGIIEEGNVPEAPETAVGASPAQPEPPSPSPPAQRAPDRSPAGRPTGAPVGRIMVSASDSGFYQVTLDDQPIGETTLEQTKQPGTYRIAVLFSDTFGRVCERDIEVLRFEHTCWECDVATGNLQRVQCPR